jgi:tetratricopeptide (TPR) repeat protein
MIFLILSLVMFLLFTPASNAVSVSHGGDAPGFTLSSADGKTTSLKSYKGKVAVVIFWRTGQERSLLALEDAMDILKKHKGKDVQVLSIIQDSDSKEEALKVFKEKKIDYPLLIDKDRQIYGQYGIRVFPTTIIIDRQGKLVFDIPSHPLTYKTKLKGYIQKTLGEISESELKDAITPHKEAKDKTFLEALRLYNLSLKFTESRMFDQAITAALKSVDANPEMVKSHILLGFLYLETEEEDKAFESFNKALAIAPDSNDAKTGLGGTLVLKGDADKAIEILESAAGANPYPQMTYYELGKAYELKGDKDKSIEMYKKAIEKIIKKKILPSSVSKCK